MFVEDRLGCYHCTSPMYESDPENSFERSITCADQYKTPNYPRTMFVSLFFRSSSLSLLGKRFLNRNVIERRQSKVSVNVPGRCGGKRGMNERMSLVLLSVQRYENRCSIRGRILVVWNCRLARSCSYSSRRSYSFGFFVERLGLLLPSSDSASIVVR